MASDVDYAKERRLQDVPQATENCCAPAKACSPDGRRFLMDHARELRQRADNIDALLRSMPGQMSPAAEEAFFEIAIRSLGRH